MPDNQDPVIQNHGGSTSLRDTDRAPARDEFRWDLNTPLRMHIALEMLRAWNHGTAGFSADVVQTVHQWIDGGKQGPIPWPENPFFAEWAAQHGFAKIEGKYVGYSFKARLEPNDPVRVLEEQAAAGLPGPKVSIPRPARDR